MEIVFNSIQKDKLLTDINMTIDSKYINAFCGSDAAIYLGEMLNATLLPTSGEISFDEYKITSKSYVYNLNKLRRDVGCVFNNPKDYIIYNTVKKEIKFSLDKHGFKKDDIDRINEALKILGLTDDYLDKNPSSLSYSDAKKVMIASVLAYNPKILIFNNVENGLCKKDQENLIRLIKLIKRKYKKTIIMISNNMNFLLSFVDRYFIFEEDKLIQSLAKGDLFDTDLGADLEDAEIVKFIKLSRQQKQKIGKYYEINELIKEVFRHAE